MIIGIIVTLIIAALFTMGADERFHLGCGGLISTFLISFAILVLPLTAAIEKLISLFN